jgi:hypothetical protein
MVATTVERRVAALEASAGARDKCPGCGIGRDDKPPWRVRLVSEAEGKEPDRWCEECGRKLLHNVNLHWGHDSRA